MKTISFVFFVCFLALGVSAQRIADLPENRAARPAQQTQAAQTASQDSIVFDKLVHDYGTIQTGSDGESVFTFTNQGKKPLLLNNVVAACGCTVPQWPRQPIAPGGKGEIKVKYNTNIGGVFNKTITVHSNAANSTVVLSVKGQVATAQN